MPIKNLTDNVAPAFQRIGKLRKGAAAEELTRANGQKYNSYGKELNFWRFASDRPEIVTAFNNAHGLEPVSLNVFLPYATADDNFATWREEWTAGGLVHRCDGETMTIWKTPDGKYSQEPRPCPHRGKDKPLCKPVGRLSVIIPELWQAGFVGYVTMETHSINDLMRITAALRAVEMARNGHEMGLRGIPMILRRVPEEISTPGDGDKRVRRVKYLVSIEPAADWVALQLAASKRIAYGDERLGSAERIGITDGRAVNTATGEIIGVHDDEDDPEPPDYDEGEFTVEPPSPQANIAPTCPKCNGPMWDNAAKKASGEMKPNAPDFKCKDRNCDGKIWPGQASAKANGNGHANGTAALSPEYSAMSKAAKAHFGDRVKEGLGELMAIYGVTDSHALTPAQCAEITEKIGYLAQGAPIAADLPF